MIKPAIPVNERERLADLYRYKVLDTLPEQEFNDLVILASRLYNVPMCFISLVDAERLWLKARTGTEMTEAPRDISFCGHAILNGDIFIVPDAAADARFSGNPLVTSNPAIRFYAGVPLVSELGNKVGTLCILDQQPKHLTAEQQEILVLLGRQVIKQLELRLHNKEMERMIAMQERITAIMAHDIRSPLSAIASFFSLYLNHTIESSRFNTYVQLANVQLNGTLQLLENLINWGKIRLQPVTSLTREINVKEQVQLVLDDVQLQAHLKENKLLNKVAPSLTLAMEENMFRFIVRNLVTNAIKFTEKGTITVGGEIAGSAVLVQVKDTGTGMSAAVKEQLLTRRGHVHHLGTQNETGSGLGLLLVQEFIEDQGGSLSIESEEEKGAAFNISIYQKPWNKILPVN